MSTKIRQQVLRGHGSSNRGIRYRLLSPSELDSLELAAAKLFAMRGAADPDTADRQIRQIRYNEGVKAMLVAITKAPVPPLNPPKKGEPMPTEPTLEDPALWEPLSVEKLTLPGPYGYEEIFTDHPADHSHLKTVFSFHHEASVAEVDDVLKKERTVSTG